MPFEDFNIELVDIRAFIGQKDTKKFLLKLKEVIDIPKSRVLIVDIIGGLKDVEGIDLLKLLLEEKLSDDEIMDIAYTLSEIPGF
ncbi:hypothetical protein NNC19_12725 [Clostridium sp. SHJSY1]|uniref:hypothetical protein n=1 Tax=Clostridium sp. SHJSY1 TaxID=2942483 RepID=UPI002874E537|nr:hypothetical protein [Clostridium sp. SHJSY1]MDS0526548.1 hypothetical protein [Clostridium sp. SHJSY1]